MYISSFCFLGRSLHWRLAVPYLGIVAILFGFGSSPTNTILRNTQNINGFANLIASGLGFDHYQKADSVNRPERLPEASINHWAQLIKGLPASGWEVRNAALTVSGTRIDVWTNIADPAKGNINAQSQNDITWNPMLNSKDSCFHERDRSYAAKHAQTRLRLNLGKHYSELFSNGVSESLCFVGQGLATSKGTDRRDVGIKVVLTGDGDKTITYLPDLTGRFDFSNDIRLGNVSQPSFAIGPNHEFFGCSIDHNRRLSLNATQQQKPNDEKPNCPCRKDELQLPPPFPPCWKPYPGGGGIDIFVPKKKSKRVRRHIMR